MDAQQLSEEVVAAQKAEFGEDAEWGQPFNSIFFDHGVFVKSEGPDVPRSPELCATNYGATMIAACLFAAGYPVATTFDWALGYAMQGPFEDSRQVPWLVAMDGKRANAGLCLSHFRHGHPADQNLAAALGEFNAVNPQPE